SDVCSSDLHTGDDVLQGPDVEHGQPPVAEEAGGGLGGADHLCDVDVGERGDAVGDVVEELDGVPAQPEGDDRSVEVVLRPPDHARDARGRHRLDVEAVDAAPDGLEVAGHRGHRGGELLGGAQVEPDAAEV